MKTRCLFWIVLVGTAFAQEATVRPHEVAPGVPKAEMMSDWLKEQMFEALDQREEALAKLDDEESLQAWQAERREAFVKALGGFPERTPLNPQITGKRSFDDYRIEKLRFESQPGLHVTATLYLPLGDGPFPAVLHPTGHSASAKNRALYQEASIVIAKGGCAVLCYDPIGQGERVQLTKPGGGLYSSTQEHMLMNQGCMLLGSNLARTMIRDGMRAIDYLQSRVDIDGTKIGCTGISGGGTNTSYLMALDDRIVAAAPGCYLTGYRRLLESVGVQDAEQNIPGQLAFGMDHADYVLMRLPKPTLIMAATEDYFEIEGTREVFREAKDFARKLGSPDRVEMVEVEAEHGFPPEMQLAAANFFRRELLGIDEPMAMPNIVTLPEEELNVTPTGRVLDLEGARSLYALNAERAAAFLDRDGTSKIDLGKVRELIGVRPLETLPEPKKHRFEADTKVGKSLSKNREVLEVEPGIYLPIESHGNRSSARQLKYAIYLRHDDVTPVDLSYMDQGVALLVVDLRGLGETRPKSESPHFDELVGSDWQETTMASLLGKSYVGMRVEDIWQCVRFLREESGLAELRPDLIAVGEAGIPALHAVALEPDLFGKVTIEESLHAWADVVETPLAFRRQASLVFGALPHYDLPDLAATLGGRLTLTHALRADGAVEPPPASSRAVGQTAAVATGHPLATQAAIEMLRQGGNAVDAAVAAGLTLGVVDGHNSGIGGGCFMLVRTPDGEVFAFDGREMAPAAARRDLFVNAAGEVDREGSKVGALASGIPGSLAVYNHVLKQFGMRALADCLKPGAVIAERGFPVDETWARKAQSGRANIQRFEATAKVLMPNGVPLNAGDVLRQPDLAATYRAIAKDGIGHFYNGPFAEKTAAWMKENGGIITAADFANYKLRLGQPIRSTYRGYEIIGMPPPSSGGIHVAQILNIMERFDVANLDETDRTHLLIEAMKLAFADRAHWLGDSDFAPVPRNLASPEYAEELARRIFLSNATEVPGPSVPPNPEDIFEKHTTHFTVADAEGWWVACTTTVNTAFGSYVMVPETGVILNNQMDDFSIQPGVPNAFGLIGAEANAIEPGKRPLSSMSPTIVLKEGEPVLTVGAAGGPTIITQVVQAIHRFIDLDLPLADCLGQPRVHQQWVPDTVRIEAGFDPEIVEALRERGHNLKTSSTGTSQAIRRSQEGAFEAVADPRRKGRADAID